MSEGEASIRPFKRRRSRKKTAICEDDDEATPGIIIQHVVQQGPEGEVHSKVEVLWKHNLSVPVDSNSLEGLFEFSTNREVEDMLQPEEVDASSKAGQGLPKVFKINIARFISYWVRFSNLSTSKNL